MNGEGVADSMSRRPCQLIWLEKQVVVLAAAALAIAGCAPAASTPTPPDRVASIPSSATKVTPQTDESPVTSLSMSSRIPPATRCHNTAGAEDSPFVVPDGKTLYFFFTPDASIPVARQAGDGVTGVYVSTEVGGQWDRGRRVLLQDAGKQSLDGCEYVHGDVMWFCSVREGLTGIHWLTARLKGGQWQDWQLADFDASLEVGEMHMTADGSRMYFGSSRAGGMGGMDIWMTTKTDGNWGQPVNVAAVNSTGNDGWPALSPDETELWFNRDYGVWRSKLVNGDWQAPEKIFSPLAGEPTLDSQGNVYFVHHYYRDGTMIEADIYVSYRKAPMASATH